MKSMQDSSPEEELEAVCLERDALAHDYRHIERELDLIKQFVQQRNLTAELAIFMEAHE